MNSLAEPLTLPDLDGHSADGLSNLSAAIESYIVAKDDERPAAFSNLVKFLKQLSGEKQFEKLAGVLRTLIGPTLDYTSARTLYRYYGLLPEEFRGSSKLKLAILGGFTTHQLKDFIELSLFTVGIHAELYEADYGVFRQEILDPSSGLYAFKPDRIYLATHWRNLGRLPTVSDKPEQVNELRERELGDWENLWRVAHDRLGCQILQNNFDMPFWRSLGNHEARHPAALVRFIADINRLLADRSPSYVTIHDVDGLSADIGRRAWGDERFYLHAKMPCAPEHLVNYAHNVASVVAAGLGASRKCLVLDLDNTLWGGVIGDDGIGGIRVGQGDAEGEGFLSFQRYVKALKMRGVILAVCSKNDEQTAREVFEKHPEMLLKSEDISCFVANWTDKAANLRSIAKQLNIGLDSLVFVDDNPAERSIIRQLVPEVAVPEVSTDPIDFIEVLERHQYFQIATLGIEDFKRSDYYRGNALRGEIPTSGVGMEEFLRSLDMIATLGPISPATLERSAQLINKSNQFNLTTRRRSVADLMVLMEDPNWLTVTASLSDRFGDNGLVSVVLCQVQQDFLAIDTWLMSCRVLKRGLEQFVLNYLCDLAQVRGLRYLKGEYIPTPKNDLVRNHYADLGFLATNGEADGGTKWELPLADRTSLNVFIKMGSDR